MGCIKLTTLNELNIGESCTIKTVGGEGSLRQHFLDMGVIPEADITLVKFAPMGDPIEFRIHDYELTLRVEEAKQIEVENIRVEKVTSSKKKPTSDALHPGLGEGGIYHARQETHNEPIEGKLTFALAGNQNSGKTTLFNQLTGSNQHVGNFPGVTVDKKTGTIRKHPDTEVTDLPGIYSLSPYSSEEIVSRNFIIDEKPNAIINIVDGTNIERNLYLTLQLMELDVPMVLAINMVDELEGNGGSILINEMEEMLQIPVVPISALKNEGVDELIEHAIHVAKYQEKPGRQDFCDKDDHGGAAHRCLHSIMALIEDHAEEKGIPLRFAASKIVEGDQEILDALELDQNHLETIEHIIIQMEMERGLDRSATMAEMRYSFIKKVCDKAVIKPQESAEHRRSQKIDRILTGKYTAIPIFVVIMALIFYLTFNVVGPLLQDGLAFLIDGLIGLIAQGLANINVNETIQSLIVDGILNGVGSVLSFVPIIVTLFFFLSLLEDSGYMARIAFVMDKLLRKIGLSGRSIVPLIMGFGCTVPAVMSTRTLPSERDRKMTILLIPFMSCSAKMPIYAFFTAAFFPNYGWLVMVGLYFVGIIMAIIVALISKKFAFKGDAVPFVMELPNYRMPGPKNVAQLVWDKTMDFVRRAFTVILLGTILVWLVTNFDFRMNMVSDPEDSILASLAGVIAFIFKPLGFGDWRMVSALVSGVVAKESVVSTLEVLFGSTTILVNEFSTLSIVSYLVFCLLYTPCFAAIASIRRENGTKGAIQMVIFQCAMAWIVAFIVHSVGLLFV